METVCIVEPKPSTSKGEVFNEQARRRLKRYTRYFPVMLADAFIYNIPSVSFPVEFSFLMRLCLGHKQLLARIFKGGLGMI